MEAPTKVLNNIFTCDQCNNVVQYIKDVRLRIPNTCYGKVVTKKLCTVCIDELHELVI